MQQIRVWQEQHLAVQRYPISIIIPQKFEISLRMDLISREPLPDTPFQHNQRAQCDPFAGLAFLLNVGPQLAVKPAFELPTAPGVLLAEDKLQRMGQRRSAA